MPVFTKENGVLVKAWYEAGWGPAQVAAGWIAVAVQATAAGLQQSPKRMAHR
ncbi:hypothetical protein [Comamonas sp. GB3 AK4-5]|uniref:hypothetical protein n=1 Tax=Comamonas sp. GB3 AK4-5 TaxID=3231487 RepID=UPI00351F1E87